MELFIIVLLVAVILGVTLSIRSSLDPSRFFLREEFVECDACGHLFRKGSAQKVFCDLWGRIDHYRYLCKADRVPYDRMEDIPVYSAIEREDGSIYTSQRIETHYYKNVEAKKVEVDENGREIKNKPAK